MPDGDKVHPKLGYRYQSVYKQICEGYLDDSELAHSVLLPFKKDVQGYGNGPIKSIAQVAARLKALGEDTLLKEQFDEESLQIEKLVRPDPGDSKRGFALAKRACKQQLQELRRGEEPDDILASMFEKYLGLIYSASFESRVPMHYEDTDLHTVQHRLECLRPHLDEKIARLASQLVRKPDVTKLRCPRRTKQPIGIHDNLLGNEEE